MRACADWPSGSGKVVDVHGFLLREGLAPVDRFQALGALRNGDTYQDPGGRWSLTPIPERRPA